MQREDEVKQQEHEEYRRKYPWMNSQHSSPHEGARKQNEEIVPDDARRVIYNAYNRFRDTTRQFQAAYKEANDLAENMPDMDYNQSYLEIIKNLPKFVLDAINAQIGYLFGIVPEERRRYYNSHNSKVNQLLNIINGGINIFNITPLNYDEELNKLNVATRAMERIMEEYEKRKKVLKKLPEKVNEASKDFLRSRERRDLLTWMEEYFANDKKQFISSVVSSIMGSSDHAEIINLCDLRKIKTYKAIHERASSTQGTAYLNLARKSVDEIKTRLSEEVENRLNAKLSTIRLIIESDTDINDKFIELKRYLNKNFRIDLSSILQFTNMVLDKYYSYSSDVKEHREANPEQHKEFIASQKRLFLDQFMKNFVDDIRSRYNDNISGSVVDILRRHSNKDKLDMKALSNLDETELNNIISKIIRNRVAKALPNFGLHASRIHTLPDFGNLKELVKDSGKFSIENLTNQMHEDFPFIPKEFVLNFVRSLFKGTSTQSSDNITNSFNMLIEAQKNNKMLHSLKKEKATRYKSQDSIDEDKKNAAKEKINRTNSAKIIMKLIERSGKMNPDTFAKIFTNNFAAIEKSVKNFVDQMPKSFSVDSAIEAHLLAIRSINTIEQDLANLKEFVQFAHNEASDLNKKDLNLIIHNKNFTQFTKLGIVKKIMKVYASIRGEGGLVGLRKKYGTAIRALAKQDYISKNFYDNVSFILKFFASNEAINPSSDLFTKAFETASSVETDLNIIEMSGSFKELVKDYKPKDKHLFNLNLQVNDRLRFRVLKDMDPRALRVGIETDCCQRIGGAAESAAKDSFINPLAGVLILEWYNNGVWLLLSQSYFHYVPEDKSFILDNIEENEKNVKASGINLSVPYAYLAKHTHDKFKTKYFLAGKGYSKVDTDDFDSYSMDEDPRSFDPRSARQSYYGGSSGVYTDWRRNDSMNLLQPSTDTLLQIKKLVGNKDAEEYPIDPEEVKKAYTVGLRRIILANAGYNLNIAAFH
jgi:hypothetical protein